MLATSLSSQPGSSTTSHHCNFSPLPLIFISQWRSNSRAKDLFQVAMSKINPIFSSITRPGKVHNLWRLNILRFVREIYAASESCHTWACHNFLLTSRVCPCLPAQPPITQFSKSNLHKIIPPSKNQLDRNEQIDIWINLPTSPWVVIPLFSHLLSKILSPVDTTLCHNPNSPT